MSERFSLNGREISETTPTSEYLGEQTITGNGASQPATLPATTNTVWVFAEGGVAYVALNGDASANSGFYSADGGARLIGPYTNISSLEVFAASGVKAHLVFEKQ